MPVWRAGTLCWGRCYVNACSSPVDAVAVPVPRVGQRRWVFIVTELFDQSGHTFVFRDAYPLLGGVRSV